MTQPKTTSLELSQRLKKLGVKQDSYFVWNEERNYLLEPNQYTKNITNDDGYCCAFLSDELGELIEAHFKDYGWQTGKLRNGQWYFGEYTRKFPTQEADSLAEAMGLMLAYLIEQGLVKVG